MVTPRHNLVLLQPLSADEIADQTEGGLWLPPSAEERQRYRQWDVVAVGEGVCEPALLPGARVLVSQYAGTPIVLNYQPYLLVFEERIDAIIDG